MGIVLGILFGFAVAFIAVTVLSMRRYIVIMCLKIKELQEIIDDQQDQIDDLKHALAALERDR